MVLSICSPFFQRLFKQLGTVGPEKTVVYLKDVQPRHLDLLIQYMYRGEIKVEEKELGPTKRGPSSQNNNQLDANGERKRTKMDVVNEAQNLLDKEMSLLPEQQPAGRQR